jgi:uncharacterized Zn finger protein (UPF0148 family)
MMQSLNCPNCGAPLKPSPTQTCLVCLYCNATVRIEAEAQPPSAEIDCTLDEAEMGEIKQLVLDGQKEAALELYAEKTGASSEDASQALKDLSEKLSLDLVRQQQLNTSGIVIVAGYATLTLVGLYLTVFGGVHWLISVVAMLYGAWMLYFYYPALASTLAFRKGKPAKAHVLKLAEIGRTRIGRQRVGVFKLLVEVQPEDGSPFYLAEMTLPVREQNVPRAQPGTIFRVKYLPGEPERVIFDV